MMEEVYVEGSYEEAKRRILLDWAFIVLSTVTAVLIALVFWELN